MTMQKARRSIFRNQALEHYIRSKEQTILPRIVKPRVFLFLWMLLGLCCISTLIAWFDQIPVYITGTGIVLQPTGVNDQQPLHETGALIFLPVDPSHPLHVHIGSPVRIEIGSPARYVMTTIETVDANVLNPGDARKRYKLEDWGALRLAGPSIAISVKLASTFQIYGGSNVKAVVQIGSRSVLSLLTEPGTSIGE
ncbi:hypothetical protein [Dictyobacter aurantiacus]|uniref:Uncharacterized protein n=1 Tax=Dictyobacter aurantiacus TaxID=1936993 RepID=A0A401ZGH8_9CHLR|nr:hypothetical protein [Dictyobacter aurantiacus]GCE05959.1 hypothetical protein KDAU_32880 [Dictyobacter aurantiacus]